MNRRGGPRSESRPSTAAPPRDKSLQGSLLATDPVVIAIELPTVPRLPAPDRCRTCRSRGRAVGVVHAASCGSSSRRSRSSALLPSRGSFARRRLKWIPVGSRLNGNRRSRHHQRHEQKHRDPFSNCLALRWHTTHAPFKFGRRMIAMNLEPFSSSHRYAEPITPPAGEDPKRPFA